MRGAPSARPDPASNGYRVNVLGHFDVWRGDADVTPARGHPSSVVQLLAVNGGSLHRDRLVDDLWPDDPPWVGQQRLRNVLHRLRGRAGGLVVRDRRRDLIRFDQAVCIDVAEFLAATSSAAAAARNDPHTTLAEGTRALMLYRGPLLWQQPCADWAYPLRIHLAQRRKLVLEALADASERLGDVHQARLYRLRAGVDEHPLPPAF